MNLAENKMETVFEEMLRKGLLTKGSSWIEKAAAQKIGQPAAFYCSIPTSNL
jgi:hypothetical protein